MTDTGLKTETTEFALEFYRNLPEGGNRFFSPANIRDALMMCRLGAAGVTGKEMDAVLRLEENDEAICPAVAEANQNSKGEFAFSNIIWPDGNLRMKDSFRTNLREKFDAIIRALDFRSKPDESRIKINRQVWNDTRKKIQDLLPAGSVHDKTRLILTSSIYMKFPWHKIFNKDATRDVDFHLKDGTAKKVPMMHIPEYKALGCKELDGRTSVLIPYDGTLSMAVILPDEGTTLEEVTENISEDDFFGHSPTLVNLSIPRFKIENELKASQILKSMGMKTAFTDDADFSNIVEDDEQRIKIEEVFHKSFVEVSEEGTEAAAATAVTMIATSAMVRKPEPVIFRADRPFLFAIVDRITRSILFMGRIEDPS